MAQQATVSVRELFASSECPAPEILLPKLRNRVTKYFIKPRHPLRFVREHKHRRKGSTCSRRVEPRAESGHFRPGSVRKRVSLDWYWSRRPVVHQRKLENQAPTGRPSQPTPVRADRHAKKRDVSGMRSSRNAMCVCEDCLCSLWLPKRKKLLLQEKPFVRPAWLSVGFATIL